MKDRHPSERFVLYHRLFTFLDEWLFYALLVILWFTREYHMFALVAVIGTTLTTVSYYRYWKLEAEMLGHRVHHPPPDDTNTKNI